MGCDPDKCGLKPDIISRVQDVLKQHHEIEKVVLYGSRAKGNFSPGSDIDLSIVEGKMDFSLLLKIQRELDDLLLPYKIDLSLYRLIENQDLIEHIERVGIPFYSKKHKQKRS